jgi:hypothetical protein
MDYEDEEITELDFTDRARYGGRLPILSEAEIDDRMTVADLIAPVYDEIEFYGASGVTDRFM